MITGQILQTTEAKHTEFRVALDDAKQVTAEIRSLVSAVRISALSAESPSLIEAELDYVGVLTATAEGGTHRRIVIRDNAPQCNYHGPELVYDIRMHPGVPLALSVGTASGDIHVDLLLLNVTEVEMGASSGKVWAALPAGPAAYPVKVGVASGDVHVKLADEARLSALSISTASGDMLVEAGAGAALGAITLNTAAGNMQLDLRTAASAATHVTAVSGDLNAQIPETAPARVEIRRLLTGSVSMRSDLNRISGGKRTGVWQTADYRYDVPAIELVVDNLVTGDVRVR
ncbi:MAG: hypothetical protein U0452_09600 [Anaerolineae bacterium]